MIRRALENIVKKTAARYPVVALVGPRQSGKTTLAKLVFPRKTYLSLENPDVRSYALSDPRAFLGEIPRGAILDEVQRAPELLSYIQEIVDENKKNGLFVLTGSNHFLVMEKMSQSLAGRAAIHKLLPLSLEELRFSGKIPKTLNEMLYKGGYPRLYSQNLKPTDWMRDYVETYLERDVRLIKNIGNLSDFHRFLRLCAGRAGQLLHLSSLADDCGITHNTAKAWIAILEASFLVFLLPPHHRNFNKRLKKSSKLYFHDTGLLCYLLGISKPQGLLSHSARGAIFENFVMSELLKRTLNERSTSALFFWQDKLGREIDCLIDEAGKLIPLEIKAGQTISSDYFKNLVYWNKLAKTKHGPGFLVYAGLQDQRRTQAKVLGWKSLGKIPLGAH